jgi:hypothetical protein
MLTSPLGVVLALERRMSGGSAEGVCQVEMLTSPLGVVLALERRTSGGS